MAKTKQAELNAQAKIRRAEELKAKQKSDEAGRDVIENSDFTNSQTIKETLGRAKK